MCVWEGWSHLDHSLELLALAFELKCSVHFELRHEIVQLCFAAPVSGLHADNAILELLTMSTATDSQHADAPTAID